jgi:hypothetical protein
MADSFPFAFVCALAPVLATISTVIEDDAPVVVADDGAPIAADGAPVVVADDGTPVVVADDSVPVEMRNKFPIDPSNTHFGHCTDTILCVIADTYMIGNKYELRMPTCLSDVCIDLWGCEPHGSNSVKLDTEKHLSDLTSGVNTHALEYLAWVINLASFAPPLFDFLLSLECTEYEYKILCENTGFLYFINSIRVRSCDTDPVLCAELVVDLKNIEKFASKYQFTNKVWLKAFLKNNYTFFSDVMVKFEKMCKHIINATIHAKSAFSSTSASAPVVLTTDRYKFRKEAIELFLEDADTHVSNFLATLAK